jgi:signal transduction histidine kinase
METLARVCAQALERAQLLETEHRARAQAEEVNQSKTELLSAMSHELRTPLNAIAGYVDLLDAEIRGPITDSQRADLRRVKRAQEMLLSLINDVLNFARLEAGWLEIDRTTVRVGGLLRELEDLMSNQVRVRGLSFRCEPCPAELTVLGDAERIRQILLNLLSNAIKFTNPGGTISVSAEQSDDNLSIRVSDTGSGIPADRLEHIFEPFVQIDRRQIEESQQGVGLGLAISRELARAMGGDLEVRSRVGEGSTFVLTLQSGR